MKNEVLVKTQQEEGARRFVARKTFVMMMAMVMVLSMGVMASATGGTTTVTANDWQPVIDALTAQVSVSTIVAVLAVVVAACVGLVFMWWGVRKAVRALMAAFRRGKISV